MRGSYFMTEEEIERAKELYDAGCAFAEIARQLGRCPQTISRVLKQNGCHTVRHYGISNPDLLRAVAHVILKGASYGEAADQFGVSRNAVAGAVYREKKKLFHARR